MAAQAPVPILRALDESPLTFRYWNTAAVVLVGTALEFFDFYIVGFIISIIAPEWNLTFGETATVLLSGGVGAIVGSFLWGWLGHRWGRRTPLILGILTFSLASGAIALAPEGAVWYLAVMRFIVGAGVGGMVTIVLSTMVELTPTRYRTLLASFATVGLIPIGTALAALLSASLGPIIGWRGLAAIGAIPVLLAIWAAVAIPESPRWLISQGRVEEARRVVAWFLKRPEQSMSLDISSDRQSPEATRSAESVNYVSLYRYRKSFWFTVLAWLGVTTAQYGITLWGPTMLRLLLDVTPGEAATFFIYIALGGFGGRILFAFLGHWVGRRVAGLLTGLGGAGLLFVIAIMTQGTIGSVSLLVMTFVLMYVFVDGGFANLAPASSEVFPTRLRSHGTGLAEVVNGFGKILGPIGLAVIAGTSNIVQPEATKGAIPPGMVFLAGAMLLTALGFLLIPETRGKTLEAVEEELEDQRKTAPFTSS